MILTVQRYPITNYNQKAILTSRLAPLLLRAFSLIKLIEERFYLTIPEAAEKQLTIREVIPQ
jgi:hypothetical protein